MLPHLRCFGDTSSSEPLDLWPNNSSVVRMFFCRKAPKEFGHCLQAQRLLRCHWISDQMTSKLVSPYHPSCESSWCFLAWENMRCSRTVDSMVVQVHGDLTAHSRRFECFCNIRLIEFGKCTESTSTTHVPSDHWSYDLDAHITVAGNYATGST